MATINPSVTRQARASRTTVFMKILMAVSGALFVLFVLAHMYGNLKIFGGINAFDEYALHLRTMFMPILPFGGALWILRVVLIVAVAIHIYSAFVLWARAQGARTTPYVAKEAAKRTLKTKWMRWGGVAIALFVIWHLIEFTWFKLNVGSIPAGDSIGQLLISSFQVWWMTLIYILAMIALGLHLYHGVWSASQTLGWANTARARRAWKSTAHIVAGVVVIGFIVPPLAILAGLVKG